MIKARTPKRASCPLYCSVFHRRLSDREYEVVVLQGSLEEVLFGIRTAPRRSGCREKLFYKDTRVQNTLREQLG